MDLSPSDALVAIRSFPRRYREVLARPDDDDKPDEPAKRRPSPDEPSALELAGAVPVVLRAAAEALRLVEIRDDPAITLPGGTEPPAVTSVEQALNDIAAAADELVKQMENVPPSDGWTRKGHLPDGTTITAAGIVRHAVDIGSTHVRRADDAIRDAVKKGGGGIDPL